MRTRTVVAVATGCMASEATQWPRRGLSKARQGVVELAHLGFLAETRNLCSGSAMLD